MAYTILTAAEAAAMINDGDMMALSGFTPNANPKAIFRELSKRAIRLHEQGIPFQVGVLTGASSCQSVEGDMAAAHALKFRAPFSTNKDFRDHTNLGEVDYEGGPDGMFPAKGSSRRCSRSWRAWWTTRICTSDTWLSVCAEASTARWTGPWWR